MSFSLIYCLCNRMIWFSLIFTAFFLEMISFFLQYNKGLQPCMFCIYENFALFGIIVSGLVGVIFPKTPLRYFAIAIWIYSSWKGMELAWKHTMVQLYPSKFMTCNLFVNFPTWIPFRTWLAKKIETINTCSPYQFQFLKLSMPQWLMIIFAIYITIAILLLLSNLYKLWKEISLSSSKIK